MKNHISFTSAFFEAKLPVSTVVDPGEAVRTEREQRVPIRAFNAGTMEQFLNAQKPSDFKTHQSQFAAVIDRVSTFAEANANQVSPALSAASVDKIKENLNKFKTHVINTDIDFFCTNRATIYGGGKTALHEIDERLHMDTIALQSRMSVLQAMTQGLTMCSGGVMTALDEALQTLRLDGSGLHGTAFQAKAKMVEALISEHVRENHSEISSGNEVHYVNEYFNNLARFFGLSPRDDAYVIIAKPEITWSKIDECREKISTVLRPELVAMTMAENYLSKVKNAVLEKQGTVDLTSPVGGDQLTALCNICNTFKGATLDKEFGDVPVGEFVHVVEGSDYKQYQLATNPIAVAQHFLQELKGQKLIDYEKTINLSDEDSPNGTLKMLGTLLWIDKKGACEEAKLADFLAVSPKEMHRTLTEKEDMSPADSYAILAKLVHQVVQITTKDRAASVPTAWVRELVDLYHQDGKGDRGPAAVWGNPTGTPIECLRYSHQESKMARSGVNRKGPSANRTTLIDRAWSNPLAMLAVKQGHADALDVMCRSMVDPDHRGEDGRSFASHAAESGHVNVLAVLENHGANLDFPDNEGNTPLTVATGMGHVDAVRFLCERTNNVGVRNRVGATPTMLAAWKGDVEVLSVLISAGGNVDSRNLKGVSALALAAHNGHDDAVDVLIANGANVNSKDRFGRSVLMYAVESGQNNILNKLIAKGASINTIDERDNSPLILAVLRGHDSLLETLVRANAKLDVKNSAGKTALMIAVESKNLPAIEALMAAGVDMDVKNNENQDAAMIAADLGHTEIFHKLIVR